VSALKCLTPFFQLDGSGCELAIKSGLMGCSVERDALQNCKGAPIATPVPVSGQVPVGTSCAGLATGNSVSCQATFSCPSGNYTVYCGFGSLTHLADCSCSTGGSQADEGVFTETGNPCIEAAQLLCN
jgi:hypothetical protein